MVLQQAVTLLCNLSINSHACFYQITAQKPVSIFLCKGVNQADSTCITPSLSNSHLYCHLSLGWHWQCQADQTLGLWELWPILWREWSHTTNPSLKIRQGIQMIPWLDLFDMSPCLVFFTATLNRLTAVFNRSGRQQHVTRGRHSLNAEWYCCQICSVKNRVSKRNTRKQLEFLPVVDEKLLYDYI